MGKKKGSGPKRNHHFVPKLYLRGFTDTEMPSMLWVYERGREYEPGMGKLTSNPYRRSISSAGAEMDHYAYRRNDGKIDYETYENALEKEEKAANKLIEKIRGFKPLNEEEKLVFAQYMTMMYKRVPRRNTDVHPLWLETIEEETQVWAEEFNKARRIHQNEGNTEALQNLDKLQIYVQARLNSYREGIPDDMRLDSMLKGMQTTQRAVVSMRWQYFQAPIGDSFVTSDSPMFRFDSLGLQDPQSEFTFPISSSLAVVGSWYLDMPESIRHVTSEVVREINRRTCSSAFKYVYGRDAQKQIYDLMHEADSQLSILYDYVLPAIGLPKVPKWVQEA